LVVLALGMLTWWWPAYHAWGALSVAVLVVLTLWLVQKTVARDRSVPGHPAYLVLLGPAVILLLHLARTGLGTAPQQPYEVGGSLNLSMLFHLCLLAAGILLAQSLLPEAARHAAVLALCGAAMVGGAALSVVLRHPNPGRTALALVGFCGVGLWLAALWGVGRARPIAELGRQRRRELRLLYVGAAVAAAVGLALHVPRAAVAAGSAAAAACLIAAATLGRHRLVLLAVGTTLVAVIVAVLKASGMALPTLQREPFALIGRGEEAYVTVSAADNGIAVLGGVAGWLGLLWVLAGSLASAVWLLYGAGRRARLADEAPWRCEDTLRAVSWLAASGAAAGAMLASGGAFIPAVTMAAAFTWGLLPAAVGRPAPRRGGAGLLVCMVALMLLLALARKEGLVYWAAGSLGTGEHLLHALVGFLLAMALAWLLGARRTWLGLLAVAIAILAGGVGELAQLHASLRTAELADWLSHTAGCAAALALFGLCAACRWCESPDVPPARQQGAARPR
jgi:hypothetical protein